MLTTTNLGLNKPEYGEGASVWTEALNDNTDLIDAYLAMSPIVHFGTEAIGIAFGQNTIKTPVVY